MTIEVSKQKKLLKESGGVQEQSVVVGGYRKEGQISLVIIWEATGGIL